MSTLTDIGRWRECLRPLLVALVAGGLYGSWAAFANHYAGAALALRAAATQAALSITATLGLVLVLERLFRWPSTPLRGFWLASVGTTVLAATLMTAGHALAGTPHIAVTIAPSVAVGIAFDVTYAGAMLGHARRQVG